MPAKLKVLLITVLSNPVIGRLSRKVMWTLLVGLRRLTGKVDVAFGKLPYVKRTTALGGSGDHVGQVLSYYRTLKMDLGYLKLQPKISILVPIYNPPIDFFKECLESVAIQVYDNWELCLTDDASTNPEVWPIMEAFQKKHPGKVKISRNEKNSHISVTSNNCLAMATGDYVALLDHDDRLYPCALAEVVRHMVLHDEPEILYSDEQVVKEDGEPLTVPFFKPSWSPQLHLRVNYTTHLSVYRRELLEKIGGFRKGFEGSQDHDLMLRAVEQTTKKVCHIPLVLYQWRAHSESTASSLGKKPYAATAGEKCVAEHLERMGRRAEVTWDPETIHYRVRYELPSPAPLVSLVICTKDKPEIIKGCLESVIEKSTYPELEVVLVDNGTTDTECLQYFEHWQTHQPKPFKWSRFNKPFNFAAMNNQGVREARGEYVVLLNNDTIVITPEWVEEMVQLAQHPETGAVGSKLLFENGKVQHAGVSLADRAVAFHMGSNLPPDDKMYMDTLNTVHETAAVTGACLCISKKKFEEVGGLQEHFVANGYGDVDFCLKLMRAGYTNIFTPHAVLTHLESPTRKTTFEFFERQYLVQTYGQDILNDPFFNPNFERFVHYIPSRYSMFFQLTDPVFQYLMKTDPEEWSEEGFEKTQSRASRLMHMPLRRLLGGASSK